MTTCLAYVGWRKIKFSFIVSAFRVFFSIFLDYTSPPPEPPWGFLPLNSYSLSAWHDRRKRYTIKILDNKLQSNVTSNHGHILQNKNENEEEKGRTSGNPHREPLANSCWTNFCFSPGFVSNSNSQQSSSLHPILLEELSH